MLKPLVKSNDSFFYYYVYLTTITIKLLIAKVDNLIIYPYLRLL